MKKIAFLITFMFANIIIFSQTQEEELKSNNWYLNKVVLNEQEYFLPHNEEVADIVNLFYYIQADQIVLRLCGDSCGTEELVFETDNTFSFLDMVCFGSACYLDENDIFDNYFWEFWSYSALNNQYQYEINPIDSNLKELIITRNNGNQAYFYSSYMSVAAHLFEKVKIYPNPVHSFVNINLSHLDYEQIIVNIYEVSGRKIKSFTQDYQENIRLDISSLRSGTYFLELNTLGDRGRGYVTKIIKK